MKKLLISKEGSLVLEELYQNLNACSGSSLKIDQNGPASGIMPVHLEKRAKWNNGREVFSVAHYFEMNGDLCADPLMEFLRIPPHELTGNTPQFIATFYQTDGSIFAKRRDSVLLNPDTGVPEKYRSKAAIEDRVFATQWMRNIAWQQNLASKSKVKIS